MIQIQFNTKKLRVKGGKLPRLTRKWNRFMLHGFQTHFYITILT
jgi:hypothetical protein